MPSSVNNLKTFGTQGAGYVETTVCNLQHHMIVNENVFILLCDFCIFCIVLFFLNLLCIENIFYDNKIYILYPFLCLFKAERLCRRIKANRINIYSKNANVSIHERLLPEQCNCLPVCFACKKISEITTCERHCAKINVTPWKISANP